MSDKEQKSTNVRRTRSGKVTATASSVVTATAKTTVKPATRKTRKKVVLMEVEISDDEDTGHEKSASESKDGSENEAEEKKLEDNLLDSPDDSADDSDQKKSGQKSKELEEKVNGSDKNESEGKTSSEEILVLNDIEMFGTEESNESSEKTRDSDQKETLKMDVDNEENIVTLIEDDIEVPIAIKLTVAKSSKQPSVPTEQPQKKIKIDMSSKDKEPEDRKALAKDNSEATIKRNKEEPKKKNQSGNADNKSVAQKKGQPLKQDKSDKPASAVEMEEVKLKETAKVGQKDTTRDPKLKKSEAVVCESTPGSDPKKTTKEAKSDIMKTDTSKEVKANAKGSDSEIVIKKADSNVACNTEKKSKREESDEDQEDAKTKRPRKDSEKSDSSDSKAVKDSGKVVKNDTIKDEKKEPPENSNSSESAEKDKPNTSDDGTKEKIEETKIDKGSENEKTDGAKQNGDPDAENISEDELPGVPVAKVPEAEEVSDEELPGPKRAELPADTEVVSEDELPTVKKEGVKRKLSEGDYDPGSPTSENEAPTKKPSLEAQPEKEKEEKKPKKLPELDKYWKAVNDDPTDFTGWTYLLQYVDQENDMEAAREAYDAFLSHYPYCYGYWRKYADYEKRKGNKKKCEEVFERGLKAIPLSVDLWIHYLTYVKTARAEDEDFVRSQFERAVAACGLEFRSDRLWDSYIKWETEGKRLQKVTAVYDRLLTTPTQGYTSHFDNFQEHVASNPPNKIVEVDEFLALRKEVRHMLKHDVTTEAVADNSDAPPGDDEQTKVISSDEETKSIRERIVSIRRKIHKATVNAVTARWNYEEGIKRPYFHVKPLERCQLKNWQDYLDYETEQGDKVRIIVLFERCLIACALYEEFWMKFVHYLEELKDQDLQSKIRDVYERACTIHHLKKPSLHLQWAMFEEGVGNCNRAAEILVNLEKSVPNVLQIAYRRINLERRRADHEKCMQLYEHYISNSKNKVISSNIAIKYSRFCLKVLKDFDKAQEVLKTAIGKDPNNPRLYLQLIDLTLQKLNVGESEVVDVIDLFLDKETTDAEQKVLFAQRKLEYLEDFGSSIHSVQMAHDQYQKYIKQSKEIAKKKEIKSEVAAAAKKEKSSVPSSSQSGSYGNYSSYGNSSAQPSYPYSGSQQGQYNYSQYGQGDQQYQYQNWQYPQGGYAGGYNQWGGYGGGYGY